MLFLGQFTGQLHGTTKDYLLAFDLNQTCAISQMTFPYYDYALKKMDYALKKMDYAKSYYA